MGLRPEGENVIKTTRKPTKGIKRKIKRGEQSDKMTEPEGPNL
jgi:hypothetical protein